MYALKRGRASDGNLSAKKERKVTKLSEFRGFGFVPNYPRYQRAFDEIWKTVFSFTNELQAFNSVYYGRCVPAHRLVKVKISFFEVIGVVSKGPSRVKK